MTKKDATKLVTAAGYTIHYDVVDSNLLYRKPGALLDAQNEPTEYAIISRSGRSWEVNYFPIV
jgi:hypothetical protein